MNMQKLMETNDSIGLLVLRVISGAIFIGHGLPKFGWMGDRTLAGTIEGFGNMGIPLPTIAAPLLAGVEVFGGALLIVGYMTRLVSAMQCFAMLVAVFVVHWSNGFLGRGGYQWALLLAATAFCLMMDGAGKHSLDRKLSQS